MPFHPIKRHCHNCKRDDGHLSNECPNPTVCNNCGKEGHMRKDCTFESRIICHSCQEEGHIAKSCPRSAMFGQARKECYDCHGNHLRSQCPLNFQMNGCHHCKQPGHWMRDCPLLRNGPTAMQCYHCGDTSHIMRSCPALEARRCYNCNGTDHLARECPIPRAQ